MDNSRMTHAEEVFHLLIHRIVEKQLNMQLQDLCHERRQARAFLLNPFEADQVTFSRLNLHLLLATLNGMNEAESPMATDLLMVWRA
jgi:hypothetical protein